MSYCSLWLCDFLEGTALTINHAEHRLERLSNHLAHIDHALVCILDRFILSLNNAMIARIVHHHEKISLFDHFKQLI